MKIRAPIIAVIMLLSISLATGKALAVDSNELVRASIIEKIARFIEWPVLPKEQFTLCIAEHEPLLPAFQNYYATGTIAGKPVKLSVYQQLAGLKDCQAIYVGNDQEENLSDYRNIARNRPILVVAEIQNAVEQGIAVDFYIDEHHLQLEVNRSALAASGLNASYHLLKVARIVE